MKNYSLNLNFPKAKVNLKTNYLDYYDYINLYFKKIIAKVVSSNDFDIEIGAYWQKESLKGIFSNLINDQDFSQIGANTFLGKKRIITLRKFQRRKKIVFDFQVIGKKIHINAFFNKNTFKDFFKYKVISKNKEELFFEITFPLIYYPLFWYSQYFLNTHMLHASSLESAGKKIIICGLEGIGKTSLSLSLLKDDPSQFISDNLIFYDQGHVYPCYELVRIHKGDVVSHLDNYFEKVNQLKALKDFYVPLKGFNSQLDNINAIIFPEFSPSFFIKKLKKEEAVNKALSLSYLPSELSNYQEYRSLYALLDNSFSVNQLQQDCLGQLLNKSLCFVVGMPKGDGLLKNIERVRKFIKDEL